MTDKERLEFIKEKHEKQGAQSDDYWGFVHDDVNFLIEQAERVQKLEESNKRNYWIGTEFKFENFKLEQENKRYREVLKEISVSHWANEFAKSKARQGLEDTQ